MPVSELLGGRVLPAVVGVLVAALGQLACGTLAMRARAGAAGLVAGLAAQELAWSLTFALFLLLDRDPPGNVVRDGLPIALSAALLAVPLAAAHWGLASMLLPWVAASVLLPAGVALAVSRLLRASGEMHLPRRS